MSVDYRLTASNTITALITYNSLNTNNLATRFPDNLKITLNLTLNYGAGTEPH